MTTFEIFETSPGGMRAAGLLRSSGASMEVVYELVFIEANSRLGEFEPERRYTTEKWCGPELWSLFAHKSLRCSAGMCMKHLVGSGVLPLELHQTESGKGKKRYYLPR